MSKMKAAWEYCCLISTSWGVMSGWLTVPFIALGVFLPNHGYPKTCFLVLAYLSLLIAAAGMVDRVRELRERLRPKLRIACSPQNLLCKCQSGDKKYFAYRVQVRNEGRDPISNCQARVQSIEKDGKVLFNDNHPLLTFAESHESDSTSKKLMYGIKYPLDVIFLMQEGGAKFGTKDNLWGFKPLHEIFTYSGDYKITITLTGEPAQHATLHLRFHWSGNYATSELWLDEITPSEARDSD